MKGDFTRCKFDTKRHYRSVRMQQGRVLLDSDWNSQMEIQSRLSGALVKDSVGRCGGSLRNAGFAIISDKEDIKECKDASVLAEDSSLDKKIESLPKEDFVITKGHYYVDGILCENDAHTYGSEQANSPKRILGPFDPEDDKEYLFYLDVWDRHITSVEDPDIREVALGGPDTTTRVETVWQVKAEEWNEKWSDPDCRKLPAWHPIEERGLLKIKLGKNRAEGDKCKFEPAGKYTGRDNHLYRVEIHDGGHPRQAGLEGPSDSNGLPYATFKWSRDNGTPVYSANFLEINPGQAEQTGGHVEASEAGEQSEQGEGRKDEGEFTSLRIDVGAYPIRMLREKEWVEVLSDGTELSGEPGTFGQIEEIDESMGIVTLPKSVEKHRGERNIRIRKWDMRKGDTGPTVIEVSGDGKSFELENGIHAEFSGDNFRSGDYWTFSARALTGEVDAENLKPMPPEGIVHRCCPLARVRLMSGKLRLEKDLRRIHPSLTDMSELIDQIERRTELSYVGGSGQEGRPHKTLAYPLQVGVSSLKGPVADTWIRFEVTDGEGHLGGLKSHGSFQSAIEVQTGEDGVAGCCWTLGHHGRQMVQAALRDKKDLPVYFYAKFEMDPDVRLREEVSRYGIIVGFVGILSCLGGILQVEMKWFALCLLIAFAVLLIASIALNRRLISSGRFKK